MPTPPTGVPKTEYIKKQYEDSKYSVQGYEYPSDLMGRNSEYGGNYAIFYINAVEDSKMIKNKEVETLSASDQSIADNERVKKAITGLDIDKTDVILGGAFAGGVGGKIAGALGVNIPGISSGKSGALVGGAAGAVLTTQTSNFTRSQKRLQTAIALHIPNDLSIRYSAGYGEEDTFATSAMLAGAKELASAGKNIGKATSNIGSIVAAATLKTGGPATVVGIAGGLAPNPKKEQAFSGVDFRSFSFSYRFAPRSSAEARNVLNIINTFKYHMHPEFKDDTGFLFLYPSEFDIVYYHGAEENLNIHRHTSCVLTDMTINYAPNGLFATFSDGMPTEISLQMTFKELTILTKELIKDGL
jgi:hypothetical protein